MKTLTLLLLLSLLAMSAPAAEKPSLGFWALTGARDGYSLDIDEGVKHDGNLSLTLKSILPHPRAFGNVMQMFRADAYRGKRVRFSAFMKSKKVSKWAGLWMRVDGEYEPSLAFDNMEKRPVRGTTDWKACSVVLDVPDSAVGIAIGMLVVGTGQAWASGLKFEVVDNAVPVTGAWYEPIRRSRKRVKSNLMRERLHAGPMNLDLHTPDRINTN